MIAGEGYQGTTEGFEGGDAVSRKPPKMSAMPTTIAGTSITARKMVICGSKAIPRDTSQFTPTAKVATLTERFPVYG